MMKQRRQLFLLPFVLFVETREERRGEEIGARYACHALINGDGKEHEFHLHPSKLYFLHMRYALSLSFFAFA
jgi:hypothetical protein